MPIWSKCLSLVLVQRAKSKHTCSHPGPNGVFVIETKGRSKPLDNGSKQFKVRVEGDALHFPRHVEREPILQTRRNVKAVQVWLSDATGFDVPVGGVLVLPGWYVELKQKMVFPYVMNSTQLSKQLPNLYVGKLHRQDLKR